LTKINYFKLLRVTRPNNPNGPRVGGMVRGGKTGFGINFDYMKYNLRTSFERG
jgi:hypothetical protein